MTNSEKRFEDGPAELYPAPDKLAAHVVDWRDGGAIHGYGVLDDLARHFAPHEVFLLGLTGETPSESVGRAFGVALTWLSACHVGLAPTHSAVLAKVCGSPSSGIVGIAAMVAAREAEFVLASHQALFDWLDASNSRDFAGWDERDPTWRIRLHEASGLDLAELAIARDAASASLIVFYLVGIKARARLVSAWAWARMIGSLSEALGDQALSMRTYPLRLPKFEYVEDV